MHSELIWIVGRNARSHCRVHCRAWLVISKNVDSSFVVRVARDFKWFSALAFVL